MPLYLTETVITNFATESHPQSTLDSALALSRYVEAAKKSAPVRSDGMPSVIYPQFHVLTADKVTRNKTLYTLEAHKGSAKYKTGQHGFTKPYPIPLLAHHMSQPEDGNPPSVEYGRMVDAKLVKNTKNGSAHVAGLGEVTHPEGVDEIMSGRWLTGSLGSSVHDASCSICGSAFADPRQMVMHVHQRGQFYRKRDPKKDSEVPTQRDYGTDQEDADWIHTEPGDKRGQLCYTAINGYQPREYSKVHTPSDDESLVTVGDTTTMAGSHFTKNGAPIEAPESEIDVPRTALWVPMSPSSRANVSTFGERYIDLVTGAEHTALEMGLLSGASLCTHLERVLSGEDSAVMNESFDISRSAHIVAGIDLQLETPDPEPAVAEAEVPADPPAPEAAAEEATPAVTAGAYCGPNNTFFVASESDVAPHLRALKYHKTLTPLQKARVRANLLAMSRKNNWAVPS